MDTDGHYRGNDSYEYSTTSKQLSIDVLLVHNYGGALAATCSRVQEAKGVWAITLQAGGSVFDAEDLNGKLISNSRQSKRAQEWLKKRKYFALFPVESLL